MFLLLSLFSSLSASSPIFQDARDWRGILSPAAFTLNDLYPLQWDHKAQNGFSQLLGFHSFLRGISKFFCGCLLRWIPVLHQKTGLNCAGRAPIPFQLSSSLWKTAQALHGTALERFWLGYPAYKRSAWLADVLSSPGCHVERHPNWCYIF